MQAGDDRSQPDLLPRFHSLLTGFSTFALRGDATGQALLEEACRTASDAWDGPACMWQYSSDTGWFHRRATARWPEEGERDRGRQPEAEAAAGLFGDFCPGERAGPVVHPAPWLGQQQFQHIARIPVRDQQAGFGYMDVGIPDASIGAGDAAFLEQLANLLGLALARVAERAQLRSALAAKDDQLREKDLMMQEVHHRVRNSLQLVHTLLTLQARSLRSAEAKHQLEEAAARIITIGSVHRRLYQGASVTETDMGGYLRRLLDDLVTSRGMRPTGASRLSRRHWCCRRKSLRHLG
jgi:two-component sensor histidine kinase